MRDGFSRVKELFSIIGVPIEAALTNLTKRHRVRRTTVEGKPSSRFLIRTAIGCEREDMKRSHGKWGNLPQWAKERQHMVRWLLEKTTVH
jgi:hypothetical protein